MTEATNGARADDVIEEIRNLAAAQATPPPVVLEGTVETAAFTTADGFEDLDAFFDDHLELPIRGKVYRIPPADAELGLLCSRLVMAGEQVAAKGAVEKDTAAVLNDEEESDIYERLLGPVREEMIADGLDWQRISHVGSTALIWTALGKAAALNFWRSGARPKAPDAPQPAAPRDRQPKKKAAKKAPTAR